MIYTYENHVFIDNKRGIKKINKMFKQKTIKREKKLQKTKIKDYHTLNSNEI